MVLSSDERAAARAFLQRCEVRLSTFHRTAVGLLSGAGLLVVLPVVARDAVSGIARSLLVDVVDVVDVLLAVSVFAQLAVPGIALWFLFSDLTRFFFHANHLRTDDGDVFTPRFTLTSLRLSADELGPTAGQALDACRNDPAALELLVPTNDRSRRRIDDQLERYGIRPAARPEPDIARAEGLHALAAARSRPLLEEVAKTEHGMARHALRLRGLVLRYVKALLAVLTTALAVYAGDAVVAGLDRGADVSAAGRAWLAGVALVWAPLVVVAVTSPVRWIEELMRDDGAPSTAVSGDPELTFVERASLRVAAVGWITAAVAMVLTIVDDDIGTTPRAFGAVVLAVTAVAVAAAALTGRLRNLTRLR